MLEETKPKRKPVKNKGVGQGVGGGRPRHQPTEEQRHRVTCLVEVGSTHEQIAEILGLDADTLKRHYKRELEVGAKDLYSRIASRLFHTALYGEDKEALTAQMFVLKTRAKWRETNRHEITGSDGGPVAATITLAVDAPKQETFEEWEERRQRALTIAK